MMMILGVSYVTSILGEWDDVDDEDMDEEDEYVDDSQMLCM